jgi:hypothetical protein
MSGSAISSWTVAGQAASTHGFAHAGEWGARRAAREVCVVDVTISTRRIVLMS